jgi:hypothetical protein
MPGGQVTWQFTSEAVTGTVRTEHAAYATSAGHAGSIGTNSCGKGK